MDEERKNLIPEAIQGDLTIAELVEMEDVIPKCAKYLNEYFKSIKKN